MTEAQPPTIDPSHGNVETDVLGGRYRLVRELGRGAMGRVYEARHVDLGRRFAIKVMAGGKTSDEAVSRFRREAEIAASLEHEHIAAALDTGTDERGNPYIVLEYVEGESLDEQLRRLGRLPAPLVVEIARQLCSALEALHERDVFHRDVKPSNVMLKTQTDGRTFIKLLDFGVAKLASAATLTTSGTPVGTAAYMAPEQLRGSVDARADLYSVGALMYHCLTGQFTHSADNLQVFYYRVLHESPEPITELCPELSPPLAALVMRLLERDPDVRPQTAAELRNALDDLDDAAVSANAERDSQPSVVAQREPEHSPQTNTWRMWGILPLLAGAAAAIWYLANPQRADSTSISVSEPAPSMQPTASTQAASFAAPAASHPSPAASPPTPSVRALATTSATAEPTTPPPREPDPTPNVRTAGPSDSSATSRDSIQTAPEPKRTSPPGASSRTKRTAPKRAERPSVESPRAAPPLSAPPEPSTAAPAPTRRDPSGLPPIPQGNPYAR